MSWPWDALGLSGPADLHSIRRAYAQRLKTAHPEEDPEGFQRLHAAYQEASRYARAARTAPAEPEAPLLDVREGVLRCKRCGNGESGLPLSAGSLAALRRVIYGDARRLYSFTLAAEDLKRLGDAAEAYVHTTLERGFQTLDFYKSLQKLPEGLS